MDFKPFINYGMDNHNLLDWAYPGEVFLDCRDLDDRNANLIPLPDVLDPYGESSDRISTSTFYDPTPANNLLLPHEFNRYHMQSNLQDPCFEDEDINFDLLKWEDCCTALQESINALSTTTNNALSPPETSISPDVRSHDQLAAMCGSAQNGSLRESGGGGGDQERRCNGRSRSSSLGFDEISKYFYMTITDAAREMKVGLTVLKKRCRELGISRWPHRKMKSLKSLIHNVQELGKGEVDETIQREIKTLEEHKNLMEKMPELELSDRTKKLRQACFKANYKKKRAMQATPYSQPGKAYSLR